MNTYLYGFVALVLQASQTYNITTRGCRKYNIPSGNIVFNRTGGGSTPTLMSYTQMAIIGADNFNDSAAMTKDVFDTIVNNTRGVTPSCKFSTTNEHLFISPIHLQPSRNRLVI